MSRSRSTPLFPFGAGPYFLRQSGVPEEIVILPSGIPVEQLAKRLPEGHLCRGADQWLHIGADGVATPSAPRPVARIYTIADAACLGLRATEEQFLRIRHFAAWHAYWLGCEPLARRAQENEWFRSATRSTEVTRFLLLAHAAAERNALLALTSDDEAVLARLGWYASLDDAWRGGWLAHTSRAWLADVATESRLFNREMASRVGRIHGREAAIPGATSEHFGQALGREIGDLFSRIDRDALNGTSRETFIGFRVA